MALAQAIGALEKKKPEALVIAGPIDLYTTAEEAEKWIETHPDGLP